MRNRLPAPPRAPEPGTQRTGLPTTDGGTLRVRWRVIDLVAAGPTVIVAFNCWRVTLWVPPGGIIIDGVPFENLTRDPIGGAFQSVNPLVFGGAYLKGTPVYLNQSVTFRSTLRPEQLMCMEETFDGYALPGN